MIKSRKFKKIALMSEVLSLQEVKFKELDGKYLSEFRRDFKLELEFLHSIPLNIESKHEHQFKPDISRESLKKIHRALVKIAHPDLNPDHDNDDKFVKIQQAYEQGNATVMVELAVQNKLDIDLIEEDFLELERQIKIREQILEDKKSTVRWIWGRSNKSVKIRNKIRQTLGINLKQFQVWTENHHGGISI
jgi:hypothetical protein